MDSSGLPPDRRHAHNQHTNRRSMSRLPGSRSRCRHERAGGPAIEENFKYQDTTTIKLEVTIGRGGNSKHNLHSQVHQLPRSCYVQPAPLTAVFRFSVCIVHRCLRTTYLSLGNYPAGDSGSEGLSLPSRAREHPAATSSNIKRLACSLFCPCPLPAESQCCLQR